MQKKQSGLLIYPKTVGAKLPPLSVSKKSTRFWTGMPLARKSKIFGLRSIPANTTPVSLKNRYILRFFAYKVFFRRACQRKNGKCSITDERVDFEVYRQTESRDRNPCFFIIFNFYSSQNNCFPYCAVRHGMVS